MTTMMTMTMIMLRGTTPLMMTPSNTMFPMKTGVRFSIVSGSTRKPLSQGGRPTATFSSTPWSVSSSDSSSRLHMAPPTPLSNDTMVNQSSIASPSHHYNTDQQHRPQPQIGQDWIHPDDLGKIPYPTHLSPSSAMEFKECPQSFLFQYLYMLKQPTNLVLTKGSMCHSALEHIFDLEPDDRTLENLQNLLRVKWGELRLAEDYKFLFEREDGSRDIDAEREWGQSALSLLENYYRSEDPRSIRRPNPYKREVWVQANLTVDPSLGGTAKAGIVNATAAAAASSLSSPSFKVRGIVDRIDIVKQSPRKVALRIVDYKTGKAPTLKYSASMNQQIFEKNFWQLKTYALLLREMTVAKKERQKQPEQHDNNGMDLRYLKLHYLTSEKGGAKAWEMDLGETQEIRDEELQKVHQDLAQIWTDIHDLVATQDPKAFVHCDRPFCYCHICRDRFVPGTVFQRPGLQR
jgi:hypothetical protein